MLSRQVGVIQHIIAQPVFCDGIVDIVALICIPVFGQLLRAEHQHGFIAVFVILDDGKSCEGFTETHTIRQNTAVEFFQLADNRKNGIPLEVIEHFPDFALFEAGCLIGQLVRRNVIQKLMENVVKSKEIDIFRRVFTVRSRDVFYHNIGDFLKFFLIIPKLLKEV